MRISKRIGARHSTQLAGVTSAARDNTRDRALTIKATAALGSSREFVAITIDFDRADMAIIAAAIGGTTEGTT